MGVKDEGWELQGDEQPSYFPPNRSIEHSIDLQPRTSLPNYPIYHMSSYHNDEIQKKIHYQGLGYPGSPGLKRWMPEDLRPFLPCPKQILADICQLGMDQRKVNMLAREYCDDIKRKNKPIILSHHMLSGLQQGQEKMSKSDPTSSIFMEDEEAEVNLKIKKAYCPPQIVEGNPCLEYIQYILLPWFGKFEVDRSEKNGGNKIYTSMEELVKDYEAEVLHPGDVKPALSKALNKILQPVRDHFKNNVEAKELLRTVKAYRVTR